MWHILKRSHKCSLKRCCSTNPTRNILEQLKSRSLVSVSGSDVKEFLQGLITNDIHHLSQHCGTMYTMFLNTKGRVLHDSILYKSQENESYFIECEREAASTLQKYLQMYRVRRKVEVSNLDNDYTIHTLFDYNSSGRDELKNTLPETSATIKFYKDLMIFKDPRVVELGSRIIAKANTNVKDQLKEIVGIVESPKSHENYKTFHYKLGIGEGFNDLPYGNCFPLESNCDYLHGISFHKGCYIGQELTARTHHTGMVRKRLMPLYFTKVPTKLPTDNIILHEGVNLGKLRGIEGDVGLALLRINKVLELGEINVGNGVAKVNRPNWWPVEAPKERIKLDKNR